MECTCYIKEEDGVEPQLIKCPLCKSAPKLVDAIKSVLGSLDNMELDATLEGCQMVLQQAIAPVEGNVV